MKMRRHKHRQARLSLEWSYGDWARFRSQMAALEDFARASRPLIGEFNRFQVAMFRACSGIGLRRVRGD